MSVFSAIDDYLKQAAIRRSSLCPHRSTATSFTVLEQQIAWPDEALHQAVGRCFSAIVQAQITAFPENIYWDFDYMMHYLVQCAAKATDPLEYVARFEKQLVRLMDLFGQHSIIRFRYVHDFSYGFDWARWVKKAPEKRKTVAPFSFTFLDYIECRGGELLDLIVQNDAKYHQIEGAQHRNPFGFSREPADERRLLDGMARDELIPVKLWDQTQQPNWRPLYSHIRKERAADLGIQKKPSPQ